MIRAIVIGAAVFVAGTAGAQEPGEEHVISVLIESTDPAIDPSSLRTALSEALARPVAAVAHDSLLTIVGAVGPEGAATVQIIGERTETFTVPRREPGWLLRWLREAVEQRLGASVDTPQLVATLAGDGSPSNVESAAGLTPPIPPAAEVDTNAPLRSTGWLNLLSVPSATVTMRGRRIGTTPLVGHEMPPGTHQLVLTTGDGVSMAIDVTIEEGRRTARALAIR